MEVGQFATDYSLQDNSLREQFTIWTIGDMYSSLRTIRYQGLFNNIFIRNLLSPKKVAILQFIMCHLL
jgi:hypothetical protein